MTQSKPPLGRPESQPSQGENLYRAIFENSNDAVFVIDPPRDAIVDVNPQACSMLGYSRDELLSTPISAIHPDEMPLLQAFAASVIEQGRGWTDELSCMTKAGNKLPAEISASSIEVDGNRHVIAMVRDVTERKNAETAGRELALVEERNRLAREIHDSLAQGLTAIIWQVNASEATVRTGGDPAVECLEQLRNLARECLQEARRSVWDLRSGSLQGRSLVEVLEQETAKNKQPRLHLSFTATGTERVLPAGVESALLRICQEAMANVLKHSGAAGATVSLIFHEATVKLIVADDGIGFDPDLPTPRDRELGGFGLISMRERAHLLGGELRVESAESQGTRIEATFPAQ